MQRQLKKRMFQIGVQSFSEYLEKTRTEPDEIGHLLNAVLINVTEFFRDPQAWEALEAALVQMFGAMRAGDSFRAWCAGCASVEEAYSLAVLIANVLGDRLGEFRVKI